MKKLSKSIFSILMAMSLFSTVVFAETAELMQISDITAETDEDVQYGFNRYDCYGGLDFEDGQPTYYTGNDAVIEFVKNDPVKTAHSGAGAMYGKNNTGNISVWGGAYEAVYSTV